MSVRYHTRRGVEIPDYQCMNRCIQDGAQRCQNVPGGVVDAAIGALDILTPHALEVALTVQAELDTHAADADTLRRQHVERARHRADLARRRYLAVDPDNRLVADSLEADWNDALRALQAPARTTTAPAPPQQPPSPTKSRTESVHWPPISPPSGPTPTPRNETANAWSASSSTTSPCTRPTASTCCLRGGQTTSLSVAIPPKAWQVRQTHPDTLAALDRLLDTHTDAQTADALNDAGHHSGEGKPFTARIVLEARRSNNLPSHADRLRAQGLLTTTEIATKLGVHPSTVKRWTKAGILNSHKANDKNERLYEPPSQGDPRLTARQGNPLRKRVPTQPAPGGAP